jgi:hypothetical protein
LFQSWLNQKRDIRLKRKEWRGQIVTTAQHFAALIRSERFPKHFPL